MQLNENFRIIEDSENVILQFHEMREKQVLVKGDGDKVGKYEGTGEFKEFTENYYYPTLETALKGFLTKATKGLGTAELILEALEKVLHLINTLIDNSKKHK